MKEKNRRKKELEENIEIPKKRFSYRPYLDGLRGISVLVVVLFHTNVEYFREGFLGVDVFFVLSGVLITSIILGEIESNGNIDIARFYARRARRILPAATITLLIVFFTEFFLLGAQSINEHWKCYAGSSTYVSNFCFIAKATDYWAQGEGINPIKHYWSLSVEEQFYLVYPFIIMVIVYVSKFLDNRRNIVKSNTSKNRYLNPMITIALCLIVLCSLIFQIYLNFVNVSLTQSHMHTLGRAYQIASGGLLGQILRKKNKKFLSSRATKILSSVFLFLICGMLFYPLLLPMINILLPSLSGFIMTIITLISIYLIETEETEEINPDTSKSLAKKILEMKIFVYFGKWSYSIYLFHFPLVIFCDELSLLPEVSVGIFTDFIRIAVIFLGSFVLGLVSYYVIERPFMKIGIRTRGRKICLAVMGLIVPLITLSIILVTFYFAKGIINDLEGEIVGSDFVADNDLLDSFKVNFTTINNTAMIIHQNSTNINSTNSTNEMTNATVTDSSTIDLNQFFHGKNVFIYGDSFAYRSQGMWKIYAKNFGIKQTLMWGNAIPPYFPKWDWRKDSDTKKYWNNLDFFHDKVKAGNYDLLVIHCWSIQKWCYMYERCNCLTFPPEDFDVKKWEDELYEGILKFLDMTKMEKIVVMLPNYENKDCLTKSKDCLGKLKKGGDPHECDFEGLHLSTYENAVDVLDRIMEVRDYLKVVHTDEFFCPGKVCNAKLGNIVQFTDSIHLAKSVWNKRAFEFLQYLNENNVFLGNQI